MKKKLFVALIFAGLMLPQMAWLQTPALTSIEKADIMFMMEEEKMARDVYVVLHEKWGKRSFDNISQAEQKHMDKLKSIASSYDLDIPVAVEQDKPGVFDDQDLQELYTQLIDKGSQSMAEAFQVGIQIEETDIKDLEQAIKITENPELLKVYNKLLEASNRHLTAFKHNLEKESGGLKDSQMGNDKKNEDLAKVACKGQKDKTCCKDKKTDKSTQASKEGKECCKNKANNSCKRAESK